MRIGRATRIGISSLAVAVLLGGALIQACSVGSDSIDNVQPTDPTPGSGPTQRGGLTLNPSEYTLTAKKPATGKGVKVDLIVTGGQPPYRWAHSNPELGSLTPYDEFGQGYLTVARYAFEDYRGEGKDTVTVRDRAGALATASITKTIEDPEKTLAITPASASITEGSEIVLVASGGVGNYLWATSDTDSCFFRGGGCFNTATGSSVLLRTVDLGSTVNRTAVVSVRSGADITTSTITITGSAVAATAPSISPAAPTVACGSAVILTASGGDGSYTWTKSVPDTQATLSSTSGASVTLTTISPAACGSTITVTVTSATLNGTATVTVSP